MNRILITGAAGAAGYNFIDSLKCSKTKYFLVGTDVNKFQLECSKLDKKYLTSHCLTDDYISQIKFIVDKEKIDLLYPQTDVEVEIISKDRDNLGVNTFLPSSEAIDICRNKYTTYQILKKNNINVPETYLIKNENDLLENFHKIKKKSKPIWLRSVKGAGSRAALPIDNIDLAIHWIQYWKKSNRLEHPHFSISELLPNDEYAFQSLWFKGKLIISYARKRLQYMGANQQASFQSSSASVSISVHNNQLNELCTKAVLAIEEKPHGLFCIDLKENEYKDICVTEINIGRFFTTCNFGTYAGVNMPDFYVKLGLGERLPPLPQYNAIKEGVYWIRGVDRAPNFKNDSIWSSFEC